MSFGLLTAVSVDDIPHILRRIAKGWRGTQTTRYKHAWIIAADRLEEFAEIIAEDIQKAKVEQPITRERITL